MSSIDMILAGSERVKGCATKTNWNRNSFIHPHALFSVILRKSGARMIQRIFWLHYIIAIYIDKNVNASTTVCSLHSLRSLTLN